MTHARINPVPVADDGQRLRVIAQALPEAIAYRAGTAPADVALAAAYAELARHLGPDAAR